MRFKKGSKVEVFSKRKVPSGSWYQAEIIHGNGHYYTVRYDGEIGALGGEVFGRVQRKAIRPCPPKVQVVEDWASNDVVEVFHRFSWKMATVMRALQTGWLLVRLLGSSHELEVNKVDIRPRLFWKDGKWNVIGKGSSNCEERQDVLLYNNQNSQQMERTASICLKNSSFPCSNISNIPKSKKRKFKNCYRQSEAHAIPSHRVRVNERDRRGNQFISVLQPPLPEKVDAVASSRAMPVEKCKPPFTSRLTGCSKISLGRERRDSVIGCSRAIGLDSSSANSITSSVASCSVSRKNTCQIPQNFHTGFFKDNDDYNSDAESVCPDRSEEGNCLLPADQKLTVEIHRIELHAYRSTMEALYASGPLSWEQETLLTNLRDSLHISNDEHLMEIRSLVSSSTCIPNS